MALELDDGSNFPGESSILEDIGHIALEGYRMLPRTEQHLLKLCMKMAVGLTLLNSLFRKKEATLPSKAFKGATVAILLISSIDNIQFLCKTTALDDTSFVQL